MVGCHRLRLVVLMLLLLLLRRSFLHRLTCRFWRVASLETPHTVKPVSSKVLFNAVLLCRMDSHVGPVDEVRGGST